MTKLSKTMEKIELGKSGILVSDICLGTMYFGTKIDQNKSFEILDYYVERTGNLIDTANNYAFWMENGVGSESEKVIGNWLKTQRRDEIVIVTKCGARPASFDGDLSAVELEGLSYEVIIRTVEESLSRLETDYIDVLYGHIDFQDYPIQERLEAFTRLKKQGKIRAIGTSNTWTWRVEESNHLSEEKGYLKYCCIQQKYSYLRPKYNADFWVQRLINEEMLDYVKNRNELSLLAYSVLLSGFYANFNEADFPSEYDTKDNRARLKILKEVSEELSCSANQLVLRWIMNQKTKIIPIISGSKVSQIEESIDSVNIKLTDEQIGKLNKAGD
jgi:aryl-alcohol dehydrogenase-like predicted oxidoreductase